MSLKTTETLKRMFSQLSREVLEGLSPEDRATYQKALQERAEILLKNASTAGAPTSFQDLVGLGNQGALPFDSVNVTQIESDFDDSVIPTQLHAAASLYRSYQFERMKVFQVAGVLLRLFHEGRMRIQSGPGARALYLLERHLPLRYKTSDRMLAYRRVFNYGKKSTSTDAVVNHGFHRQFVAFNAALAQYFRDLLIGEVIRGGHQINQRPFGSQATIQRLGADLRDMTNRATYGNVFALSTEVDQYLSTILNMLETPDIKKAFDANNKWDVIEVVSQRHLGGAAQLAQRAKMADAGQRLLNFVADDPFNTRDFNVFQAQIAPFGPLAEEWIAAYRMTPDGRNFRGVGPALESMLGTSNEDAA